MALTPQPCVCHSMGREQCRDCHAWLCDEHNRGGTWVPRCDACFESRCRRHARWSFPLYGLFTVALIVSALSQYLRGGEVHAVSKVNICIYVGFSILYWTHWTGRAFRKKPPRAVARRRR